jgi:hypothetical protein
VRDEQDKEDRGQCAGKAEEEEEEEEEEWGSNPLWWTCRWIPPLFYSASYTVCGSLGAQCFFSSASVPVLVRTNTQTYRETYRETVS